MDTPVYYETLAAWGWEECVLCLMPERPGGHHQHRVKPVWSGAYRDLLRADALFRSMHRFASDRHTDILKGITEA
jgi:hypothetical protein